jgi:hypothetical protein
VGKNIIRILFLSIVFCILSYSADCLTHNSASSSHRITPQYLYDNESVFAWIQDSTISVPRKRVSIERLVPSYGGKVPILNLAKNEHESFQIILTPKTNEVEMVKEVTVFPPILLVSDKEYRLRVELKQIGFINQIHPDALFPFNTWKEIHPKENFHIWVTIKSSKDTPAGNYRGKIDLFLGKGSKISIPFQVEVWDFKLSAVTHLQNYLGGYIDTDDIANRYELSYWSEEFDGFMSREVFSKLIAYRMMPRSPTPIPSHRWGRAPRWVKGRHGKALWFDGESRYYEIPLSSRWGVRHTPFDVSNAFTLEAWIKIERLNVNQSILNQGVAWGGGYELFINKANKIVFRLGHQSRKKIARYIENKSIEVTSRSIIDQEWHHIAATFANGHAKIYIDGELDAYKRAPFTNITRSYRPILLARRWKRKYQYRGKIDEVRIYRKALDGNQIANDMKSSSPLYQAICDLSFETYPPYVPRYGDIFDPEGFAYFSSWAKYWVDQGFGFSLPHCKDIADLQEYRKIYYRWLKKNDLFDKCSIRLPYDEAIGGERGAYNSKWAKEFKRLMPEVRTNLTTGGRKVSSANLTNFRRFIGLVDIWVPNIYKHYLTHAPTREFFDSEIKAGREVNFYFKWTRLDREYLDTRHSFWLMMKYGFGPSLYRATFWTRPLKRTRAEKYTWREKKGFISSRSSMAGVGYGIYFWPGENELIPSVRAEIYRDGVEDYEYYYYLKELTSQLQNMNLNGKYQLLLQESKEALEIPVEIWNQVDSKMMSRNLNPKNLYNHRHKLAEQITRIQRALGNKNIK